ncbi:porphobilinogen synthase [Slackia heliotrinireducens]|uniref:Delta-aminolevulinic acid dehydratase n=1 Tax=Slackia heliotrinireducens (strain ATCC 29202 / DSM 20476 / NCTC 11029 / RHS 1) TaxID=471855 RepID=C7N5L3_SLAHD|nr:porphobilinogen synthase [Slackia heliotrinireducens]ACV22198.1 porphobilinogen synthase [Slackia heliotrinireducens DSM 20476]VEH00300.1 Delta-aminolevulinic acid dehydratase [Slackia heliotrinireducens]
MTEYGKFPAYRPRRMRANATVRSFIRETQISAADFIYPLFVMPGEGKHEEVPSMPGVYQVSLDTLPAEIDELTDCGVPAVLLFGLPSHKDEVGSEAYDEHGIVQEACRVIKAHAPEMYVITDVCLCEYTSHGHCGKLDETGYVMNDPTLELLAAEAVSHAAAGADMVAPSDMMDGRIAAIRSALDQAGFENVPIMSYSTKYASGFYGPFRDAADSAPAFGDRRAYQMDPANVEEGVREAALDIAEGADFVMVKPALPYLDVLNRVKREFNFPTAAYNVSGEYAMIKAAAANGWIDEKRVVLELLTSIKRAGADVIITYHAKEAARWLSEE